MDITVWPKQQSHLLLNLLMGDCIVLFPPILESLTTSKLTDFSVFQQNTWKTYNLRQHIKQANYSHL